MITFELRIILVFLVSFFAVVFVLPKIANIAQRIGLLDQPNERKMHTKPRPLVGGIGMVIAVTFASLVFIPINGLRGYFIGLAILLLIGFLDDFREMGHLQKFMAQIVATAAMIQFSNVALLSFGDLLGLGDIIIPGGNITVWLITIFCVVGVINAVNLIDGLDGLAGGLSFIAFIFFAIHASFAGNHTLMLLNLALAGAVFGFLKFNWYPSVLFMGDAGSLCLGFSLAFMALALTQCGSGTSISPVIALLILAVPITDTIIVMFKRIIHGKSPFKPDKYHLHHIFLRYGMSRAKAVHVILIHSILLGGVSILSPLYGVQDKWLFLCFATYFCIYLFASFYIVGVFRYSLRLRKKRQHLVRSDMALRYLFGCFDYFKLFRKSKRYNVNIAILCTMNGSENTLRGHIFNISQTGCMIRMASFNTQKKNLVLSFKLQIGEELVNYSVDGEHLWKTQHEGVFYHGLRFNEPSQHNAEILNRYLMDVAKRQQHVVERHVNAP